MNQTTKYFKILCSLLLAAGTLLFFLFVVPKVIVFFMPFVIGFVLSLIANPMVRFLERKIKMKRKYGTVLMIVLVIAAVVFCCYGVGLLLIIGIREFMDYLPTMYENAQAELNAAFAHLQALLRKIPALPHIDVGDMGSILVGFFKEAATSYKGPTVSAISGFAMRIPDILVSVIMGLLATYFFIADRDRLLAGIKGIPLFLYVKRACLFTARYFRRLVGILKRNLKLCLLFIL